ncbi:MAG: hypothetical protein ACE5KI_08245, partial [Dehalococcoidia bacterium]
VKLGDGVRLLRVFTPRFFGVDTEVLCRDSAVWLKRIEVSGPINWRELDRLAKPRVSMAR